MPVERFWRRSRHVKWERKSRHAGFSLSLVVDLYTQTSRGSAAKTIRHSHAYPASYAGYVRSKVSTKRFLLFLKHLFIHMKFLSRLFWFIWVLIKMEWIFISYSITLSDTLLFKYWFRLWLLQGTEKWATKNVQLVFPHCCKTSWIAVLRVLPPTFKPVDHLICCRTGLMWVVKGRRNIAI